MYVVEKDAPFGRARCRCQQFKIIAVMTRQTAGGTKVLCTEKFNFAIWHPGGAQPHPHSDTHTDTHMEHTRIHTLWVAHGVYLTPLRLSQHPTALTCQPTRRSGSQASQPASHCCWKSNCYSSNGHCCRQLLLLLLPLPRGSATLQFCWLSLRAAFGGNPAVACATNEMSGIYSQLI